MSITNLTGYTWVANEHPFLEDLNITNVEFTSNGNDYDQFSVNDSVGAPGPYVDAGIVYINSNTFDVAVAYSGTWDDNYKTVLFTGGSNVTTTDPGLLAFLETNGTLTPPSTPSIADKLQDLIDIKQDIKVAIENKNVDLTAVDFSGYAEKIDDIPIVVELTQEEYDELESYDNNTYYLIVEE